MTAALAPTCSACRTLADELERHHQLITRIGAEPEDGPDPFRAERRSSRTRLRLASDADELTHHPTAAARIHNAHQADVLAGHIDPTEEPLHA